MSDIQNNPLLNRSPAENSVASSLRKMLDLSAMDQEVMVPARVVLYDRANNTATVHPLMKLVDMNEDTRSRNTLSSIPVLSLGGGGFHINFPLKAGDLGWIIAADRDISLFKQTLDEARPTTLRKHKFNDAWFIPDVFRKYTIAGEDTDAMVIQALDSSTRIAISNGKVNITAPTSVTVTTPIATFSQDVHVKGNIVIDKNMTVTGLTMVNGGFNATGGGNQVCILPTSTTIGGIVVYGHGHVETNSGRTAGGMVS